MQQVSVKQRREYLLNEASELSIRSRCSLLQIARSNLYYQKVEAKDDTEICSLILDIWLAHTNKGWRSIQADLKEYHEIIINHKYLRRLMKKLSIKGVLPKSNLSKANSEHKKYPYGMTNLELDRANLVWCSDITYVKLPQGFVYLVAIVDIYSRAILDWEISNTLDAQFCIRVLERSIVKYGVPAMFNTDQGVQYTSEAWINVLIQNNVLISMDGKGRWADNIWVERIWRTVKYECIFLNGIENLLQLKQELAKYIDYYNQKRLHSSLNYKQPFNVYKQSIRLHENDQPVIYCKLTAINKGERQKKVAA